MKKGQAAMEFLMSYGWAILVVLAAIGALAYFGVLSPDKFLPPKCTIGAGFSCMEYKASGSTVQLRIRNNLGVDASVVNVTLTGKGANSGCSFATYNDTNVDNGADVGGGLISFDCGSALSGSKFSGDITVTYVRSGDTVSHTAKGSIVSPIE